MRLKRLKLGIIILFSFGLTELFAQTDVTSAGGNASGSGGSLSYSVGQVNYTANSGEKGSVSQGVQQTYEIIVIDGIGKSSMIELSASVFPNPAYNFLTLKVASTSSYKSNLLSFNLYDLKGQLLESKKITDNETVIDVSKFAPSIYFLSVNEKDKEIKNFKIVKK